MILIMYRLYNPAYGPGGNPKTLIVSLHDNAFRYNFYSGWQDSGMGEATGNFQMKESLPMGAGPYRKKTGTRLLDQKIRSCLASGCGSNRIHSSEIINKMPYCEDSAYLNLKTVATQRGYDDYELGITKCPYKGEEFQSYWSEGWNRAELESQQNGEIDIVYLVNKHGYDKTRKRYPKEYARALFAGEI